MAAPKGKGKKEVQALIKLQIKAGQANPAPPIGPALGQHGVNIMDFCKQFNAATSANQGELTPVVISVYKDRSFSFEVKTPPVSYLLKQALKLKSGSSEPNRKKVGKLSKDQVAEIAKKKMVDMNAVTVEAAVRSISGTARSMGIEVVE